MLEHPLQFLLVQCYALAVVFNIDVAIDHVQRSVLEQPPQFLLVQFYALAVVFNTDVAIDHDQRSVGSPYNSY